MRLIIFTPLSYVTAEVIWGLMGQGEGNAVFLSPFPLTPSLFLFLSPLPTSPLAGRKLHPHDDSRVHRSGGHPLDRGTGIYDVSSSPISSLYHGAEF